MSNYLNRQNLINRSPFLIGKLKDIDFGILLMKWGYIDNKYHSTKFLKNNFDIKITDKYISKLENDAINIIDDELEKIFTCSNCKVDTRKCGLFKKITGYNTSKIFISANGTVAREVDEHFSSYNYPSIESYRLNCLNCDTKITRKELGMIVTNGLSPYVVEDIMHVREINPREIIAKSLKCLEEKSKIKDKINIQPPQVEEMSEKVFVDMATIRNNSISWGGVNEEIL